MSNFEKRNLRSGHLMWPGGVTFGVIGSSFFGNVSNCGLNSYSKFGGATRRRFFRCLRKTWDGGGWVISAPPPAVHGLTRAPLGYFYNAPHWGGAISSPPLISETTGPILKIQAAFKSPRKTVEGKQILLTSVSRVTSQIRSKSKCSTFRAWWHRRAKLRC